MCFANLRPSLFPCVSDWLCHRLQPTLHLPPFSFGFLGPLERRGKEEEGLCSFDAANTQNRRRGKKEKEKISLHLFLPPNIIFHVAKKGPNGREGEPTKLESAKFRLLSTLPVKKNTLKKTLFVL